MLSKIEKAAKIAKQLHFNQMRKYTFEPYFNHCSNVAYLTSLATRDEDAIAAAYLHDVIEDVLGVWEETSGIADLKEQMGERCFDMIMGLTDQSKPSDGNREIRKAIDREKFRDCPTEVKIVKCADILDNMTSIVEYDKDFARVFLKEIDLLLPLLYDSNNPLYDLTFKSLQNNQLLLAFEGIGKDEASCISLYEQRLVSIIFQKEPK